MFLAGILFSCMAYAHPVRHAPESYVRVVVQTAPASRWIPGHFDRFGYWIPGHWIQIEAMHVSPPVPAPDCHRHSDGHVHCGRH